MVGIGLRRSLPAAFKNKNVQLCSQIETICVEMPGWRNRFQSFIAAWKYGTPEKRLTATFALAWALVASYFSFDVASKLALPELWAVWTGRVLFGVALLVTFWLVVPLFKLVTPPPELAAPAPTAFKGPFSFGPADGDLFRGLSRENEIEKLLDFVLNQQTPLVVVCGESGTGKTSLLRAGLEHTLKSAHNGRCIYWSSSVESVVGLCAAFRPELSQRENGRRDLPLVAHRAAA